MQNIWEIIVKGSNDCLTGTEQYMQQKEYLYGAQSMLDQSIGGIINDFYDEDFDCDSEYSPMIRLDSVRNSSAGG